MAGADIASAAAVRIQRRGGLFFRCAVGWCGRGGWLCFSPVYAGVQPQPHGRDFARRSRTRPCVLPAQGSLYRCFPGDILARRLLSKGAAPSARPSAVVAFT